MNRTDAWLMDQAVARTEQRQLASALRRRRDLLAVGLHEASRPADGALDQARARGVVDALAAAVELGSVDGFVHYALAAAEIGEPRGIPRARLDKMLADLREQLGARFAASEVGPARSAIDAARLAIEAASFASPRRHPESREPFARERARFVEAALAARWHTAYSLVSSLLADGHRLLDVYADLIAESLYEVGRRWARAEIAVADQHVATAVSEYVLSRLYTRFPADEPLRGAAVVACAPTEAHQTGAHIVADALELDGWDVRFLGANAAPREVVRAVEDSEASLVAFSASLLPAAARAARLIEQVRDRFGEASPRIIVGGGIIRAVPDLWRAVGADACAADVRGAAGAARAAHA